MVERKEKKRSRGFSVKQGQNTLDISKEKKDILKCCP